MITQQQNESVVERSSHMSERSIHEELKGSLPTFRMRVGSTTRFAVSCLVCVLLVIAAGTTASRCESVVRDGAATAFETPVPISISDVHGRRTSEGDLAIYPGETVRVRAFAPAKISDLAWRLRLVGEVDVDPRLRTLGGFAPLYALIDDALDSRTRHHQTYSCALHSNGDLYARRAYWRLLWDPTAEEHSCLLRVWMKKESIEILPGGRVGIEVAVFQKRSGRNPGDITGPADAAYFLDAGEGSQDWQELQLQVKLKRGCFVPFIHCCGGKLPGRSLVRRPAISWIGWDEQPAAVCAVAIICTLPQLAG